LAGPSPADQTRLGDRKFFNLFARLASETNPDHDVVEWKVAGANWRRQRHVYWSQVSFQVETHEIRCVTHPSWAFTLVHEIWWDEDAAKSSATRSGRIRNTAHAETYCPGSENASGN
jgi:hypothetical protein